jgi:hypothetical protein
MQTNYVRKLFLGEAQDLAGDPEVSRKHKSSWCEGLFSFRHEIRVLAKMTIALQTISSIFEVSRWTRIALNQLSTGCFSS